MSRLFCILIVLGSFIFTSSCDKDDEGSPDETISDKLNYSEVALETKIATISGPESGLISFEYEGNRVSIVTEISEYSDDENEYTSYSEDIFTFNYSGDVLESISVAYFFASSSNGQADTTELEYTRRFIYNAKGQVLKVVITVESFDSTGEIIYSYDDEQNLEKIDEGDGYFQLMEWQNKNVSTETAFYDESLDEDNSRLLKLFEKKRSKLNSSFLRSIVPEKNYTNSFSEFDDKVNPLGILAIISGFSNGLFISQNNPSKVNSISYNSDGTVDESTISTIRYEYNSAGLPTKYSISGDGESDELFITYK